MRKNGIFLIIILALVLVGCSGGANEGKASDNVGKEEQGKASDNFAFKNNGLTIPIDGQAEEILDKLGEPMEYFEAPSCAYQGLDKTYYYNGFEITTYTEKEVDYVASVLLVDDTVTTDKGIYIGSSIDDMIKAHGEDYEEKTGQYTYTKGDSQLQFIFKDDLIVSILYTKII